jgi:hypothetical protein
MPRWKRRLAQLGRWISHPGLWQFLLQPATRYVITWLATLGGAGIGLYATWTAFDTPKRADGNDGHVAIDFGGQYVMGRMLVTGNGRYLYHRDYQRFVVNQSYPAERGDPHGEKTDAESLLDAFILLDRHQERPTTDRVSAFLSPLAAQDPLGAVVLSTTEHQVNASDVGGPLYPPINALLFAPLALLEPQPAYHVMQVLNILLAFLSGWGIRVLSQGRIWWPIAAGAVMLYPGFNGSITLGQNATLTLTILIWGWVMIAADRPVFGGALWGLLAFKPVWAAAFFLVPLLTWRWRVCIAMLLTGGALAIVTLPFVGMDAWKEWLQIGQEASVAYKYDANWIPLSRDLLGLPRRWLDFQADWVKRKDDVPTTVIGWALIGTVFSLTVAVTFLRRGQSRAITGPPAAFLLLGAWLCCFHFMYYDVLLSALAVLLLFTEPRRYLEPRFVSGKTEAVEYYRPRLFVAWPTIAPLFNAGRPRWWVWNRMIPTLTTLLYCIPLVLYHVLNMGAFDVPADTICLMLIWLWCGWLWLREEAPAPSKPQ